LLFSVLERRFYFSLQWFLIRKIEMEITFNFDKVHKILYKRYSGEITYTDFESSWMEVIRQSNAHFEARGFLLDYRRADMTTLTNEVNKIAEFFHSHLSLFGSKKIAFIASTPEQIVIPMLLHEYDLNYQSRSFSTVEAAEKWIIE